MNNHWYKQCTTQWNKNPTTLVVGVSKINVGMFNVGNIFVQILPLNLLLILPHSNMSFAKFEPEPFGNSW